jgi:hypothetical protein
MAAFIEADFVQQSQVPSREAPGGAQKAAVSDDNAGSVAAMAALLEQAQAEILAAAPPAAGQVGTGA